jgi:hypothetical protein
MHADLIARDRDECPVLLVEVKTRPAAADDIQQWLSYLEAYSAVLPSQEPFYGMMVDPDSIVVFPRAGDASGRRLGPYPTTDVLRHYDADFVGPEGRRGSERGFGIYLEGLIQSWLQDLIAPWKGGEPPLKNELSEAGLLKRLEGGTVAEEGLVRDDSLY